MIRPKKIIITCGLTLFSLVFVGANIVSASEITGSITSGDMATSSASGTISGSVGGSASGGTVGGTVGGSTTGGTVGGSIGGSSAGGIVGGTVGAGGTLSGTVTGGVGGAGGGGGGVGGGAGGGPIVLGASTASPLGSDGGLVLGVSTSTSPEFPTTGFGPANLPFDLILLTLLVAAPIVSLSSYLQKKRKKFMESRRINEFSIDESIFS